MHPSALVSQDVDVDNAPWNLPRQRAFADDADGEFVQSTLLGMLEENESSSGCQSLSQVLSGNEHGPPVWDPDDFLELKDLDGSAFSASLSAENTCVPSMTLDDECFDPEAFLRELAPSAQLQNTVSAPRGPHQVVIQPPPSGSVGGSSSNNNIKKPLAMKIVVSASVPYIGGLNHTHPPAIASVEELLDVGSVGGSSSNNNIKKPLAMKIVVSASVPYIGGLNHTHPPAIANVEELLDVGRISKLSKKYFCFV